MIPRDRWKHSTDAREYGTAASIDSFILPDQLFELPQTTHESSHQHLCTSALPLPWQQMSPQSTRHETRASSDHALAVCSGLEDSIYQGLSGLLVRSVPYALKASSSCKDVLSTVRALQTLEKLQVSNSGQVNTTTTETCRLPMSLCLHTLFAALLAGAHSLIPHRMLCLPVAFCGLMLG